MLEQVIQGIIGIAVLAIIIAITRRAVLAKLSTGSAKMQEISSLIHDGALSFLKKQYRYLLVFIVIIAALLAIFLTAVSAFAFILGAVLSALAGNIAMRTATNANARTAEALKKGIDRGFNTAFRSASITGLSVSGLALLGLTLFYYFVSRTPETLFCFALGASTIALFARVGGGIFTKAADVGADLVGKVELGIPEDDPRNPAVIADNVGDNVGDVVGMSADLFQSYTASVIAAMVLAIFLLDEIAVLLPLLLSAFGIFAGIVGCLFVRAKNEKLFAAIDKGTFVSVAIMALLVSIITFYGVISIGVAASFVIGLIAMIAIGYSTEYVTSPHKAPTKSIAVAAQSGAGTNLIAGISVGMLSTALPVAIVVAVTLLSFQLAGIYGIAIAVVGMLSLLSLNLSIDTYGSIADNAEGISEMAGMGEKIRLRAEKLDAVGNSTSAIGKGFATASAALTAIVLFILFIQISGLQNIDITNPFVLMGFFIGALIPFLFSAFTMRAVGTTANKMVVEVRRQFKQIKGLMEGKAKPDYDKCIGISTEASLKEMIVPSLMALILPILFALVLGLEALGGFLIGATITGFLLAVFMISAGTGWDNAKKFIKAGHFGGKKSDTYKAAVVGDTVGDPFKDTAGPALGILIKLMIIVALVIAPLLI